MKRQGDIVCRIFRDICYTDSCENYVDINLLFDLKEYYDKNFMQKTKDKSGIDFCFDLEIGDSYGSMASVRPIEKGVIEMSGTASTLLRILWKIQNESDLEVSTDIPIESIVPQMEPNPMIRFIHEKQISMDLDYSYYKVKLTKLN